MKSECAENSSSTSFVLVCEENSPDDTLELPLESNGTLAQSTLQAQFPGATGLKYKKEGSDRYRGVRVAEGFIYPPEDGSWANTVFVATFPKGVLGGKRKADDGSDAHATDGSSSKEAKVDRPTSDLIVLSLPYKAGESELRQYFSQFGQIAACDIKRDKDGHSRGFGFVRFSEFSVQERVLGMRHYIDGRWCDVKIPNSQIMHESNQQPSNCSSRVFVGRLAANVTEEQIRTFFGKFGPVTDIYLPRPFRSCAFVTFRDISVAQGLVGKEFTMDGNVVHIACANPRMKDGGSGGSGNKQMMNNDVRQGGGSSGGGGGGGGSYNQQSSGGGYSGGYGGRSGAVRHGNDMNNNNGNGHMGMGSASSQAADLMSYFGSFGNFGGNQGMYPSGPGGGNLGGSGRGGSVGGNSGYGGAGNRSGNASNNMPPPMGQGGPGGPGNMMNSAAFIAALSSVINQSGWQQNPGAGGQYPGGPGGGPSQQNPYAAPSSAGGYGDGYGAPSGGYGGPGGFGNNSAMYR